VIIAKEERAHLIFVVTDTVANCVFKVEKRRRCINLDFALKIINLIGYDAKIENHSERIIIVFFS
jgi:hypothetical protein